MLSDKELLKDKARIQGEILKIEDTITLKQQELQQLQTQLIRFTGALGYIVDNLNTKEDK